MNPAILTFRRKRIPIKSDKTSSSEVSLSFKPKIAMGYSRTTHAKKDIHKEKFIPHFLDIIARGSLAMEARERIYRTSYGTYRYRPSLTYMVFVSKIKCGFKQPVMALK